MSRQPQRVVLLGESCPPSLFPNPFLGSLCVYVSQVETAWIIDAAAFFLRELIAIENQKLQRMFKFKCFSNFLGKVQRQVDCALFYLITFFKKCIAKI